MDINGKNMSLKFCLFLKLDLSKKLNQIIFLNYGNEYRPNFVSMIFSSTLKLKELQTKISTLGTKVHSKEENVINF